MGRRIMTILLIALVVLAVLFWAGPRIPVDLAITFDPERIGADPQAYLDQREAQLAGIRPGLAKEIVWADPATRARTRLAIVYVHGFSASKGEVRPLPDRVAGALKANLFYTRLTGHAQDGPALATASVNDWINDYAEAIAIGHRIGETVIVIATSTGASLAIQAADARYPWMRVSAMALISPNFGVNAVAAPLLNWPWGRQIAEILIGAERSFPPRNAMQAALWTTRYPTIALLPMAALTRLAYDAPVETFTVPALFIFSDQDSVVRADRTRVIAGRWGGPHEIVAVTGTDDADHHVIAGDALSPSTTDDLAAKIADWFRRTVPGG